jgi:formate dehydrogenase major subunit
MMDEGERAVYGFSRAGTSFCGVQAQSNRVFWRLAMAVKPNIDLTSIISSAVSGLRLRERVGNVPSVKSKRTQELAGRVKGAKPVVSLCCYCAVGCSLVAYVSDEGKLLDVEGNPASPVNEGHLCPKGSAIFGLTVNDQRWTTPKYRAPNSNEWVDVTMDWALDRIAEKFKAARDDTFVTTGPDGKRRNHTLGLASLGGATFGIEENYLLQKLFKSSGVVSIENQARI